MSASPNIVVRGIGELAISDSARVESFVVLDLGESGQGVINVGERSKLKSFSVVRAYNGNVAIGRRVSIGEHCLLAGHGSITIGDHVILGSHCSITSSEHIFSGDSSIRFQGETISPVVIEPGAWLGAGVRVTAGVTIGQGSVVGAGSIVTRDVPPSSVAYGVPCRVVASVEDYSLKGFDLQ
jgi:acetyltransferase-like isoleucine patch superfamily enzyme